MHERIAKPNQLLEQPSARWKSSHRNDVINHVWRWTMQNFCDGISPSTIIVLFVGFDQISNRSPIRSESAQKPIRILSPRPNVKFRGRNQRKSNIRGCERFCKIRIPRSRETSTIKFYFTSKYTCHVFWILRSFTNFQPDLAYDHVRKISNSTFAGNLHKLGVTFFPFFFHSQVTLPLPEK